MKQSASEFFPLSIAILTVSDLRGEAEDTSGHYLVEAAKEQGHNVVDKCIVKDNLYTIRAVISQWIADPFVQVVLINGGTGFTQGDHVPEAIRVLFDREIEGFGELFRMLSYQELETVAMQSRALAGLTNQTLIFAMPGSPRACKTAWEKLIMPQLDARQRCSFVPHISR